MGGREAGIITRHTFLRQENSLAWSRTVLVQQLCQDANDMFSVLKLEQLC